MGRVVHLEIHCADRDRAERFYQYTEVFGWRIDHWEGSPIDYRLITTWPDEQPGINGALTDRRGGIGAKAVTAYVNPIQVEDLGGTQRRIGVGGGEQVVDPAVTPGVGTVAYFQVQ